MEEIIGQDKPRILKSTGPAKDALEPARIQVVDRPIDPEKVAMLAFMEELVEVHVHTTTNDQDEQIFEVFNNGEREIFRRGETKAVKRKFVERLARAKTTTYSQKEVVDSMGVRQFQQIPQTGLRYPFSVTRDDHPRGADWLRAVLQEA